jgi:chaperonin GroES
MFLQGVIMNIHPIRDQVVVSKQKEAEKISPGGIITPNMSSNRNVEGTVVAAGSGRVTMSGNVVPLEVKTGDTVLFNPGQAIEVQNEGSTFFVLREDAVIVLR